MHTFLLRLGVFDWHLLLITYGKLQSLRLAHSHKTIRLIHQCLQDCTTGQLQRNGGQGSRVDGPLLCGGGGSKTFEVQC